jgi:hypothetical protein
VGVIRAALDAEGFGQSRAHEQVTDLAAGGRRVAQGTVQEVGEDVAHADGRADHSEGGKASTDVFCGFSVHESLVLVSGFRGLGRRGWAWL